MHGHLGHLAAQDADLTRFCHNAEILAQGSVYPVPQIPSRLLGGNLGDARYLLTQVSREKPTRAWGTDPVFFGVT